MTSKPPVFFPPCQAGEFVELALPQNSKIKNFYTIWDRVCSWAVGHIRWFRSNECLRDEFWGLLRRLRCIIGSLIFGGWTFFGRQWRGLVTGCECHVYHFIAVRCAALLSLHFRQIDDLCGPRLSDIVVITLVNAEKVKLSSTAVLWGSAQDSSVLCLLFISFYHLSGFVMYS